LILIALYDFLLRFVPDQNHVHEWTAMESIHMTTHFSYHPILHNPNNDLLS